MRAHHGDKQIGNARAAYLAERSELVAADAIKQQNASTENGPLVHRLQGACGGEVLRIHHHFEVTRIEFFHAALEHDAATVDENQVREHILYFFHLMCCHDD